MNRRDRLATKQPYGPGASAQGRASGEIIVPVQRRLVSQPDGTTTTEISLNLQEIPIPERRYVADVAWVDHQDETVRFIFAQKALVGEKLRSVVMVSVYPEPARQLIAHSHDFMKGISDFLERNDIKCREVSPPSEEPSQTVALTANMMSVTFAGREAEWDFFHLPPSGLRKLAERSDVVVDPVVRIDLNTSTVAAVLRALERLLPKLPREAK